MRCKQCKPDDGRSEALPGTRDPVAVGGAYVGRSFASTEDLSVSGIACGNPNATRAKVFEAFLWATGSGSESKGL